MLDRMAYQRCIDGRFVVGLRALRCPSWDDQAARKHYRQYDSRAFTSQVRILSRIAASLPACR